MFEFFLAGIIGLVVIYIIIKMFYYQKNIIEGLVNKNDEPISLTDLEDINNNIKREIIKTKDSLLIEKYKETYEDLIINLDELTGLQCLDLIRKPKYNASDINTKIEFKENLNIIMSTLE